MMKRYFTILVGLSMLWISACSTTVSQNSYTNRKNVSISTVGHSKKRTLLARITTYWARGKGSDYHTRRHNASTGKGKLKPGHCAVDPKKIKYGSKIIYPNGTADVAVDTGRDVINRKAARKSGTTIEEKKALVIDKFFETRTQALAWARNHPMFVSVKVIPPYKARE